MTPQRQSPIGVRSQLASLLSGAVAVQALGLLLSPVVARIYGPVALGELAAASVVASGITTLAMLAFDSAIVMADSDADARELAGVVIVLSSVAGILSALAVGALASTSDLALLRFSQGRQWVWGGLIGATVVCTAATQVAGSLATREQAFSLLSTGRVVQAVVSQLSTLAIGILGYGGPGAALALVLGQVANIAVLSGGTSRPRFVASFAGVRALLLRYRAYPIYSYPQSVLDSLRENAIVSAVAVASGSLGLGYWGLVGRTIRGPAAMVSAAFAQVISSRVSAAIRSRTPFLGVIRWALVYLLLGAGVALLIVLGLGPQLFALVFGEQWRGAGDLARAGILWFVAVLVFGPFVQLVFLFKKNREFMALGSVYNFGLILVCLLYGESGSVVGLMWRISAFGALALVAILGWLLRVARAFANAEVVCEN